MDLEIKRLSQPSINRVSANTVPDDDFQQTLGSTLNKRNRPSGAIYFNNRAFVAISSKFEEKMLQNPELAREISQKINEMSSDSNNIIIVDRSGEIVQYSTKTEKRDIERELADAKEAAKARLRKKARLDAYFKMLQRNTIKRKLVEQENAKRLSGKKYRCGTALDFLAKCLVHDEGKALDYQSR